ncbi:MAG: hypothetical protein KGM49_12415 [Sphingomonadales bacterium]|nr:hypothetical protein [Sphingomonadales bacterium]
MTRRARFSPPGSTHRQRGAGALIVVLVLFFVMSLVAAYSSRNIIFEQKTSANQYRSSQAAEAAEAGIEWAIAMLNAGNVDANCQPVAAGGISFANRYLTIDTTNSATSGTMSAVTWPGPGGNVYQVGCVGNAGGGWTCQCPTGKNMNLGAAGGGITTPAFMIYFGGGGPGTIAINSVGCSQVDYVNCLVQAGGQLSSGEAVVRLNAVIALKGAVATPPSAALTVPGTVCATSTSTFTNLEPRVNGTTVDSGGGITVSPACPQPRLVSMPGTPSSVPPPDTWLAQVLNPPAAPTAPSTPAQFLQWVLGMPSTAGSPMYQQQPAAIRLACPADCAAANLVTVAANNPGRILWLTADPATGDVTIDSPAAVNIGSATGPIVMVVNGNLNVPTAAVTIFGLVYGNNNGGNWTVSGSPVVQGAMVGDGNLTAVGSPSVIYDFGILNLLRLASGSYVRVPGSWQGG